MATAGLESYKDNPQGIADMLNSEQVRAELTGRMERVAMTAEAGAGGEFSYHVEQATTDRAVVRVGSDDPHVIFYEQATGNLVRALDAAAGSS